MSRPTLPPSQASTASLQSLQTALSVAAETDRSARLLFSPDRASADTNETGRTGSTEAPGAATRSLVLSVDGDAGKRFEAALNRDGTAGEKEEGEERGKGTGDKPRCSDVSSVGTGESWDRALSLVGSPQMGRPFVHLPTPEPEEGGLLPSVEEALASRKGEQEQPPPHVAEQDLRRDDSAAQEIAVKQESDDEHDRLVLAAVLSPAAPQDEDQEEELELETDGGAGLTNSQEDAGLEWSVTRSQTNFSAWLEDQMRRARREAASTIESDDALSSILLATRQTCAGGFGGGAPPSPALSQTASILESPVRLEDEESMLVESENLTVQTVPEPGVEDDKAVDEEVEVKEEVEQVEEFVEAKEQPADDPLPSFQAPSTLGWKLLTFSLSVALAYSLARQPLVPEAVVSVEEPTRSLRYIPINESTVETSHFATPLPVGSALGLPAYAVLCAVVAAAAASIPLIRRGLSGSAEAKGRKRRASSPLVELNGDDLLRAHKLLPLGVAHYHASRLVVAADTFTSILSLACAPNVKAIASEWLGRTLYRLARHDGNDHAKLEQAVAAFERSIRLDSSRAAPRASLGRAKYRLADYPAAVSALRAAIKRDENLAFSHEWLAKSLAKVGPRPADAARMIEQHLLRAIELCPSTSSTAHAFLGEFLHLNFGASRLADAKAQLQHAVSLRSDYPAAHARLAFIANEELELHTAASHYALVCETRQTGLRDEELAMSSEATEGVTPWLGWVFATPVGSDERREVLKRAKGEYPNDDFLTLLLAIDNPKSAGSSKCRTRAASSALLTEHTSSPSSPETIDLETLSTHLARRADRYSPTTDLPAHGLLAFSLLALKQSLPAEQAWERFWGAVSTRPLLSSGEGGRERREEDRLVAFLAVGFWEMKRAEEKEEQVAEGGKDARMKGVKGKGKGRGVRSASASASVTPTPRRSTRASSAALAAVAEGDEVKDLVKKVRRGERKVEKVEVGEAVKREEETGEEETVKVLLRRSPRKVKREVDA